MNQITFFRSIGLGIAAPLCGAFLAMGCGSADGSTEQSPTAESQEALRARLLCAGPQHLPCFGGQYCNAVSAGHCPGPSQFGMCAAKPQVCSDLFSPVCGCDGQTYPNACHAAAVGVAVDHDGECAAPEKVACGGFAGTPCPGEGKCVDDPSDDCDPANGGADCSGICSCLQTLACIKGTHFDNDPAVCTCVPDAACIQTQLCIKGTHFDNDPAVCACVPDDKCAAVTCPVGEVCCPSCGVCQPQGLACNQTGCTM
jgi:hypothetical protein